MGRWLVLALLCGGSALASPASAGLLRTVYPRFDESGYRANGRRVGWTNVQRWPARAEHLVMLVEQLEAEGSEAPSQFELVVLEKREGGARVVARHTGWRGFKSTESCPRDCARRMVGLDLGDFAFCPDETALGVVTEVREGAATRRRLEWFRVRGGELVPLVEFPQREETAAGAVEGTPIFMKKRGQPCHDLQIRLLPKGGGEARFRRFKWTGDGYREEGG